MTIGNDMEVWVLLLWKFGFQVRHWVIFGRIVYDKDFIVDAFYCFPHRMQTLFQIILYIVVDNDDG